MKPEFVSLADYNPQEDGGVCVPTQIWEAMKQRIVDLQAKVKEIRGAYDQASQDLHDKGLELAVRDAEVAGMRQRIISMTKPFEGGDVSLLAIMLTAMHEGVADPSRAEIAAAMTAIVQARLVPSKPEAKQSS